ncbi:hypothetical protein FHE65_31940 [Mumia zhuanghuii]|uniref:Uncharacterized protein n=2 Tax=Mumia zhuanghuii TaxID=2585211 RepID=A0A5C4MD77_9ACTN|nr:hypothetical protein FHE65_31940 [Mumia zhuanghuii]
MLLLLAPKLDAVQRPPTAMSCALRMRPRQLAKQDLPVVRAEWVRRDLCYRQHRMAVGQSARAHSR